MSEPQRMSGPQFRGDRPEESEAVRTTIVGGRPPGSGKPVGDIPRGIEVLVKKASIDPEFRQRLLDQREAAAASIGLQLDPAEALMLRAAAPNQLEAIIAQTTVPTEHRRAFLGTAAAVMLAAIGVATPGCGPTVQGIRPAEPPQPEGEEETAPGEPVEGEPQEPGPATSGVRPEDIETITGIRPERMPVTDGIRPDEVPVTKGVRPDRPPAPTGIRPDLPPAPGAAAD
jgi:hypothetical protein